MYTVTPLFAVPLYQSKVQISPYINAVSKDEYFTRYSADNGDASVNKRILDDDKFAGLRNEVVKHIDAYVYDYIKIDPSTSFTIENSWIVRHQHGDFAPAHMHRNSIISGILYLDVDDESGNICFINESWSPISPPAISLPISEYNTHNCSTLEIVPQTGDILLFPSTLRHSVNVCQSHNLRYCLAFNVYARGTFIDNSYGVVTI